MPLCVTYITYRYRDPYHHIETEGESWLRTVFDWFVLWACRSDDVIKSLFWLSSLFPYSSVPFVVPTQERRSHPSTGLWHYPTALAKRVLTFLGSGSVTNNKRHFFMSMLLVCLDSHWVPLYQYMIRVLCNNSEDDARKIFAKNFLPRLVKKWRFLLTIFFIWIWKVTGYT